VAGRREYHGLYYALAGSTVLLTLFGLAMVLSASWVVALKDYGNSFYFFERQIAAAVFGAIALVVLSRCDAKLLLRYRNHILGVAVALLAAVFLPGVGDAANGARSWLELGALRIQPSEFAKIALTVWVAAVLVAKRNHLHDVRVLAGSLALGVGLVLGLILMQPDLGTAVIIAATVFIMLYFGGAPLKLLIELGVAGGVAVAIFAASQPFRVARLFAFLHAESDPQGAGYNILQSLIALGSGGVTGVGPGMSRQKFLYLPASYTDFILAVIGEELGLIGTLATVLGFGVLIYAGFMIARRARDDASKLLVAGLTSVIAVQALVNMGAVTGLLPVTGVTLPLVSYGGTSLVATMAAVGIMLNVASRLPQSRSAGGRGGVARTHRPGRQRPSGPAPRKPENARRRPARA